MEAMEILLYALGPALLCYALTANFLWTLLVFGALVLVGLVVKKPWQLTLEKIGSYIDKNLEVAEYSSGLLLQPDHQLSSLAFLQRNKVDETLRENIGQLRPDVSFKNALLVLGSFMVLAFFAKQFEWAFNLGSSINHPAEKEEILFQPLDSSKVRSEPPKLEGQKLFIRYPSYTKKGKIETSKMNVKALQGSRLSWQLKFDQPISEATFESSDNSYTMSLSDEGYTQSLTLNTSGFYNFKYEGIDGTSYQSKLYALEMFEDESPEIKIEKLKQFTSFDLNEEKLIQFETVITDDYGISEAFIVATVSKGEGESVKFREERMTFEDALNKGGKHQKLSKQIDLNQLNMEPGDELYFYVTAIDNKEPKPNTTRSETYFAVIRDTLSGQFAVEGTMGADLMPDYFRSQRQLIIDTEKLIADKSKLSKKDFNFTSNELGFDQKALRLKYGEFMGDEADSGIQVTEEVVVAEVEEEDDEDPLSNYTHDHDGSNEHNPVDHEHDDEEVEETEEDPLESYLHNHDDPEESTLFTQSLKSKLRQAMAEMWDAELYLRLYTPEESLPYQYRALKLIQEIKNSARIYVHRIGFDPPPIKEDKRLTGDLDEVNSFQKQTNSASPIEVPFMKQAVKRVAKIIQGASIEKKDRDLFSQAGNELAQIAIAELGKHLETLQRLKWISDSNNAPSKNELIAIQKGLLAAIPKPESKPKRQRKDNSELNTLFLKELEIND